MVNKSDRRRGRRARISATDASRSFSTILDEIERGATYLIRRRGKDVCVMTSPTVSARKASACLEMLRGRGPVTLDDRFGADLLGIIAAEPIEDRPWGS
jgi:hypothetical protein